MRGAKRNAGTSSARAAPFITRGSCASPRSTRRFGLRATAAYARFPANRPAQKTKRSTADYRRIAVDNFPLVCWYGHFSAYHPRVPSGSFSFSAKRLLAACARSNERPVKRLARLLLDSSEARQRGAKEQEEQHSSEGKSRSLGRPMVRWYGGFSAFHRIGSSGGSGAGKGEPGQAREGGAGGRAGKGAGRGEIPPWRGARPRAGGKEGGEPRQEPCAPFGGGREPGEPGGRLGKGRKGGRRGANSLSSAPSRGSRGQGGRSRGRGAGSAGQRAQQKAPEPSPRSGGGSGANLFCYRCSSSSLSSLPPRPHRALPNRGEGLAPHWGAGVAYLPSPRAACRKKAAA